jgi:hypothetical protein
VLVVDPLGSRRRPATGSRPAPGERLILLPP